MLRLRRTLALCFWCFVLHRAPASADEESPLRPPPPTARPGDAPPPDKTASFWSLGTPTRWIPSMSSLTPWGWSYEKKAVDESTGTPSAARPTEPIRTTDTVDSSPEEGHSGSEDKVLAAPQTSSSTSLERSRARWTETGTVALLVEGTSVPTDSARMSAPPSNSHSPVPGHHSVNRSSSRDDLFSLTHTHTNRSVPTPTHVLDTAPTRGNGSSANAQNILKESEEEDPGPQRDPFVTSVRSTITPESTVPTAIVSTPQRAITVNPALLETTLTRHTFRSTSTSTPSHSMVPTKPMELNVNVSLGAKAPTATESQPRKTVPDPGLSEAKAGPVEERPAISTTVGIGAGSREESAPSTTQSPPANSSTPGETLDEDEEEEDRRGVLDPVRTGWDVETTRAVATTTITTTTASMPLTTGNPLDTDDWLSDPTDVDATFLPDCNQERSGICNSSDSWASFTVVSRATPAAANDSSGGGGNRSSPPFPLLPAPPMLVPLHSDWPSAMAAWGPAWEAHVYGLGSAFAAVTLASALNLLCLPLRCPSGCGYFGLVSLFLLAAGGTRAFSLLYDAYGHRGLVASAGASLLLYEAPFPCLTAAFGLAFLLLSMRSRMQLSYSAFQRPCVLAFLVLLHFAAAFGPAALLRLSRRGDGGGGAAACLLLSLVSRGAFVALASFLSAAYFVFYCYVRADAKHIYRLNNTSPTPAERYNRCPFAESRDWERAAAAVCLAALLSLACAALQLYAVLHAAGLAGGADGAFRPWPWWAFQFSCRACEAGVCLALALVVAQPVYCADRLPQGAGSCWAELLAAKSPAAAIVGGSYQWTLGQQEKLAICGDAVGHGETECLPLYTLVDERLGSSLNGLDLLYHSNRALAYRDLDPPLLLPGSAKPEGGGGGGGGGGATSGGSSLASDSTADLRPPSPIDLRRSIDEALFSEALFPVSLFGPSGPFRCSDASLAVPNGGPGLGGTVTAAAAAPADPGLYRTSSCAEMAAPVPPPSPSLSTSSSCSSPERWRGSSSSCSLCGPPSLGGGSSLGPRLDGPSAGGVSGHAASSSSGHQGSHLQRRYRTLGSASQESLDLDLSSEADRSVQEEFVSVCRQMDALSVCSETIDL